MIQRADPKPLPVGNFQIINPDMQDCNIGDISTSEGQAQINEHLDGVDLLILDNLGSVEILLYPLHCGYEVQECVEIFLCFVESCE